MAKPPGEPTYSDKLAWYEKLVATNPSLERKGASVPYTSLNGHMFSYLSKEGKLALRLPAAERDAFLKKYKTKLCDAYGSAAGIRRGARLVARVNGGAKEILRLRFRVRKVAQTESDHKKEDRVGVIELLTDVKRGKLRVPRSR